MWIVLSFFGILFDMSGVLQSLFSPFSDGFVHVDADQALFLNAELCSELSLFSDLLVQQNFKPYADILMAQGYKLCGMADVHPLSQKIVFVQIPKNKVEAQHLIAQGLMALVEGGVLVCAADNKSGGGRLKGWLEDFGLSDIQVLSKHKAKVAWGSKVNLAQDRVDDAYRAGLAQVMDHGFVSQAGIFGWDKIDKGSQILLQHLPSDLKGRGADFGCGYGYLAQHILQHCEGIFHLVCLDADLRAVSSCAANCGDTRADCRWEDLSLPVSDLKNLSFIIMNPPFHEGKKTDIGIGKAFIQNAYASLRRGGVLYMVANAHLPYESVLSDLFFKVDKIYEGNGFKVFFALK